jgi:general secretion pathway protein A
VTQNQITAFADLMSLWNRPMDNSRHDYCSYARDQGLECLVRTESLDSLRSINRPAVLTLHDDDGSPFYVVMTSLKKDRAEFMAGEQRIEVALSAIMSRWFGNIIVLWQPPLSGDLVTKPGEAGKTIPWLAKSLEILGLYQQTGQEVRLEGTLLGAFKRFQFDNGLTSDGVLGPMSLIRLNTARSLAGPRLYAEGAG